MRKNGFTLVEMMTVIIIMVTLGFIAVFSITGIIKSSTDKLYQIQINSILDASRTYAVENSNMLSDHNVITLCDLKRTSLLEKDLKNPKTEKQFDNSLIIEINKNSDGEFDFSFDAETTMEGYYCDLDISLTINGDSPLYVKLGDSYEDQGVEVKRKNLTCTRGNSTSTDTACYYKLIVDGNYSDAMTSNRFTRTGIFKEDYRVIVGDFSSKITRTIVVEDKTPPQIRVSYGGTTYTNSFSVRVVEDQVANFSCSAIDNVSNGINCAVVKDEYAKTSVPGTYDIIYSATDAVGNTSTLLVNVTVLSKNKSLIAGLKVSTTDWTKDSVTLKIVPLYSSGNCGGFLYTFDGGNFWISNDTLVVTENGNYNLGIKCQNNDAADFMKYNVTNIDKVAPEFESTGSIGVTSNTGEVSEVKKNELYHYYSSGPVSINRAAGATDSGSGVGGYIIYVNNEVFNETTISGDGKYEIKLVAFDYPGNMSEPVLAGYIVISSFKPTCSFLTCTNSSSCNSTNPIVSDYITYTVSEGYKINTNMFPIPLSLKLQCSYSYYDGEEDIYENTNLPRDGFFAREMYSSGNTRADINSVYNNPSLTETVCNNGICTKTNHYVTSINLYKLYNPANIYFSANSFCDRVGNCNQSTISSMTITNP